MGDPAVDNKYREGHAHEDRAERQQLNQRLRRTRLDELGQECQEKDGQLRVEDVQQERLDDDARRAGSRNAAIDRKSRLVAPRGIGDIEKVRNASVFEHLKGHCTCVHDGRQTEDGGGQMGNDSGRTAEARVDACRPALNQAGGDRVDHSSAGNQDDNQ